MPMLGFLLALFFIVAALSGSEGVERNQMSLRAESEAIAGSMLVYRNYVSLYAVNNPAASGVIPDSALGLPAWYLRPTYLSNYVSAGKSYVYYTAFVPGLAGAISASTGSINVGTNSGGVLNSSSNGQSIIVLPGQVPVSSVVIVQ
ncbi:type IV pilus biogenesis protein PilM [Pseudomonas fragariae (ex Marin et al. 2024)]|uniref:type IV pilus biogenesis protein PilM n=1 Tax=Pseudomonas fragariae (ex Marin et al. 2024) TaxID=3080056 RepID=UPI003F791D78